MENKQTKTKNRKKKNMKTKNKKATANLKLSPEEREAKAAKNRGHKLIVETSPEVETQIPVVRVDNVALETPRTINLVPIMPATSPIVRRKNRGRENVSMIATRDESQSEKWEFSVIQEELQTSSGKASGIHAVIREDTGQVIGQYRGVKVLPYPELVQTFERGLADNGLAFQRSIVTTKNGARFFARYKMDVTKVGNESFGSELRLQSSHDGSLTPGFSYSAERLACLNCMMVMSQIFAMFKKHSEKFDLSFIGSNINNALQGGQTYLAETVDRMTGIAIDDGQARNVLSNIVTMGAKVGVSPRLGYLVHHNWTNPTPDESGLGNNLYRLCNAATRVTRDIEKVGRFELSRKANRYLVGAFDLAARRSTDLEKLLATPATPLDFDHVTVNN